MSALLYQYTICFLWSFLEVFASRVWPLALFLAGTLKWFGVFTIFTMLFTRVSVVVISLVIVFQCPPSEIPLFPPAWRLCSGCCQFFLLLICQRDGWSTTLYYQSPNSCSPFALASATIFASSSLCVLIRSCAMLKFCYLLPFSCFRLSMKLSLVAVSLNITGSGLDLSWEAFSSQVHFVMASGVSFPVTVLIRSSPWDDFCSFLLIPWLV